MSNLTLGRFRMLWVLMASIALAGCASLPEFSRTQSVHDIRIENELVPAEISVNAGDEVRWVNMRRDRVTVQIPDLKKKDLLCESGFTKWTGAFHESVSLKPHQSVALCFKQSGLVRFNVRAKTLASGADVVMPGRVMVSGN